MRPETCLTSSLVCVQDQETVVPYSENSFCEAQRPKIARAASTPLLQLALSPAWFSRARSCSEPACGTWCGCTS